jgi:RNA polymerase sigma factor (sigma-70 family)
MEITNNDLDMVKSIAYKYRSVDAKDSFLDELIGEGCVGLAKALFSWKPKKASKTTYKYTCINNAMLDYLRKSTRNNNEINIEEGVDECFEDCLNPEEIMIRKEEINEAEAKVLEIISELSVREQDVLFNHVLSDEPDTLRTVAKRYSCSKDSIMRDKKRILERLKM